MPDTTPSRPASSALAWPTSASIPRRSASASATATRPRPPAASRRFMDGNVPLSPKSRKAAERLPEALDLPREAVDDA